MGIITMSGREWESDKGLLSYQLLAVAEGSAMDKSLIASYHSCNTNSKFSEMQLRSNGFAIIKAVEKVKNYEDECFGCLHHKLTKVQTTISPTPFFLSRNDRWLFTFAALDILFFPPLNPKKNTRLGLKGRRPTYGLFIQCLVSRYTAYCPMTDYSTNAFLMAFQCVQDQYSATVRSVFMDQGSQLVAAEKILGASTAFTDEDKKEVRQKAEQFNAPAARKKIIKYFGSNNIQTNPSTAKKYWGQNVEGTVKLLKNELGSILKKYKIFSVLEQNYLIQNCIKKLNNRVIAVVGNTSFLETLAPVNLAFAGRSNTMTTPIDTKLMEDEGHLVERLLYLNNVSKKIDQALTARYLESHTSRQLGRYKPPGKED